jgi:ABC-2 type transport system permease protein
MKHVKGIKVNISTTVAELYKSIVYMRRNYFRLFDVTVWPIILFFAITLFLKFVSPSPEILSMAITGLIGWRAVYHFQIETNLAYMDQFWGKNTAQIMATPVKIVHMLIAGAVAGAIKFLIVLTIYLTLAYSLFSFQIADMFRFVVGISFLCVVGFILGMITLAIVILYQEKAITFSFMVPDLMVLLSGVYYPISVFPGYIVTAVHVLPTFYGFELLKSMVGLGSVNYLWMLITGAVWLLLSLWILYMAVGRARKNGSFSSFN